jgi:flagellar basal body-associated protein FliL
MRKIIVVLILVLAAGIGISTELVQAQEAAKDTSSSPEKNKPAQSYRLDFSFNEIADGKIVTIPGCWYESLVSTSRAC